MNRIDTRFQQLRAAGEKAFIAYICAGDPTLKATEQLAHELAAVGVDILELGVPFSDPLADGLVNQLASERALRHGTTPARVLRLVKRLRTAGHQAPVVLYIYYNLIHCRGVKRFAREAAAAGVDGILALDLPPEEAADYEQTMQQDGVHPIYLVAPTTPGERIKEISRHASGFIYYVSREGVTGMQQTVAGSIGARVKQMRRATRLPIVVGFGVSTPAQASEVAAAADGVVVGSAIVDRIARHGKDKDLAKKVGRFVKPMVKAVKQATR